MLELQKAGKFTSMMHGGGAPLSACAMSNPFRLSDHGNAWRLEPVDIWITLATCAFLAQVQRLFQIMALPWSIRCLVILTPCIRAARPAARPWLGLKSKSCEDFGATAYIHGHCFCPKEKMATTDCGNDGVVNFELESAAAGCECIDMPHPWPCPVRSKPKTDSICVCLERGGGKPSL